jgi:guanylate kinase
MSHLFLVSAPSGAGKTSLLKEIYKNNSELVVNISYTTRAKRTGEKDGVNYNFVSKDAFQSMIKNNEFAEYAEVFGNFYGTALSDIKKTLSQNKNTILEIDCQGVKKIYKSFPEAISIFILPPSIEELEARIEKRNDNTDGMDLRKKYREREISQCKNYNYIIINKDFDLALTEMQSIFTAYSLQTDTQLIKHKNLLSSLLNNSN